MRLVILLEHLTYSGGLFRFERVGRVLRRDGIQMCWLSLSAQGALLRDSEFAFYSIDEFQPGSEDVYCVPGAGFSDCYFQQLKQFREFPGRRIQHVLNDPHRLSAFQIVNKAFQPHAIVFNNRHWSQEQGAALTHGAKLVLEGAVDTDIFSFRQDDWSPSGEPPRLLTLANKNPEPVIEAARRLGGKCILVGRNAAGIKPDSTIMVLGPLSERALADQIRGAAFVCHTEIHAGWANLAAEACAVGTPLIATEAGTRAFLTHAETGYVIASPTADRIIQAVNECLEAPDATAQRTLCARRRVERFNWSNYAKALLEICRS